MDPRGGTTAALISRVLARWLWPAVALAVLLWTLLAWLCTLALGHLGDLTGWLAGQLSAVPELQVWVQRAVSLLEPFGATVVWTVWGVGAVVALACGWAASWLLRRSAGVSKGS